MEYHLADGTVQLTTVSFVKFHCEMDFLLYPIDTQNCVFQMRTTKDMTQQVRNAIVE